MSVLDHVRDRVRRAAGVVRRALVLTGAWLVCSLPVVTWLAAAAALVHAMDRSTAPGHDDALTEFREGWRRHWRAAVPLGTAALLVLAALLVNLLFLTGRSGVPAFLLLVGTLLLLALWGMAMVSLVPVLALRPHLPVPEQLRTALALAFARPLSALGLLLGAVLLVTALVQVWVPLVIVAVPVVGHLSLVRARRHLPSASGEDPVA